MNKAPCFYLPKEIVTAEYKDVSNEAKLLFSMIFTNATNASAIKEAAQLINKIGSNRLNEMHKTFLQYKNSESEREGA